MAAILFFKMAAIFGNKFAVFFITVLHILIFWHMSDCLRPKLLLITCIHAIELIWASLEFKMAANKFKMAS